jgi:DNA-binding transcriptional LysR family regulator
MDALTLDQFLVFATVADEGSFSAASRKLGRAQSAVTYAIQKLEDQTGGDLFDRTNYRPVLTEAGRVLLPQARRVLAGLDDYRRTARAFTTGLEAEVHIAVDAFVPMEGICATLCDFSETFADTAVRLHASIAGHDMFLARYPGAMAYVPELGAPITNTERNSVGTVELTAVAAPTHPLARFRGPLSANELAAYFQIVLSGQHFLPIDRSAGVQATRRWYADNLVIKHDLIRSGLGWGSLPRHIAADDLASGRLIELDPERWDGADRMPQIPYVLARSKTATAGPASAWLFESLSANCFPATVSG